MTAVIAFVSVLVVTQIIWAVKKSLHRRGQRITSWFCPICIGVSLTWLGLAAAWLAGYSVDPLVLGLFMGGSVVGISYKVKETWPPLRRVLWWRFIFIPVGFSAAFLFINQEWTRFAIAMLAIAVLSAALLKKERPLKRGEEIKVENSLHSDITSSPRQEPDSGSARSSDGSSTGSTAVKSDAAITESGPVPPGSGSFAHPQRYASEPMTSHMVSSASRAAETNELRTRGEGNDRVGALEKQMEQCC